MSLYESILYSLKLYKKKYFCWIFLLLFFILLKFLFNNENFTNLLRAELNLRINNTITIGVWRNPIFELVLYMFFYLGTYVLILYGINRYTANKIKDSIGFKIFYIIGFYLIFNFVLFFITGILSEVRVIAINVFVNIILSLYFIMVLENMVFTTYSKGIFVKRVIQSIKSNFVSLTITIFSVSVFYSILVTILNKYIYPSSQIERIINTGNLTAFLDIINKPEVPHLYDIVLILVNTIIYSFIIYFTSVVLNKRSDLN